MLDQPLPAGPITQERKVGAGNKSSVSDFHIEPHDLFLMRRLIPLQHGPSDEVTSEEEEEEEMGEVCVYLFLSVH